MYLFRLFYLSFIIAEIYGSSQTIISTLFESKKSEKSELSSKFLKGPFGLAFNNNGSLIVTDESCLKIFKLEVSLLDELQILGENVNGEIALSRNPTGISFDSIGIGYFASAQGNLIAKISEIGSISVFTNFNTRENSD